MGHFLIIFFGEFCHCDSLWGVNWRASIHWTLAQLGARGWPYCTAIVVHHEWASHTVHFSHSCLSFCCSCQVGEGELSGRWRRKGDYYVKPRSISHSNTDWIPSVCSLGGSHGHAYTPPFCQNSRRCCKWSLFPGRKRLGRNHMGHWGKRPLGRLKQVERTAVIWCAVKHHDGWQLQENRVQVL